MAVRHLAQPRRRAEESASQVFRRSVPDLLPWRVAESEWLVVHGELGAERHRRLDIGARPLEHLPGGHGTPPRLRRGCVRYYQHTGNDTTGTVTVAEDQRSGEAEEQRGKEATAARAGLRVARNARMPVRAGVPSLEVARPTPVGRASRPPSDGEGERRGASTLAQRASSRLRRPLRGLAILMSPGSPRTMKV